jgi:hypothetical protein
MNEPDRGGRENRGNPRISWPSIRFVEESSVVGLFVIPVDTGIQKNLKIQDPRLRGE